MGGDAVPARSSLRREPVEVRAAVLGPSIRSFPKLPGQPAPARGTGSVLCVTSLYLTAAEATDDRALFLG